MSFRATFADIKLSRIPKVLGLCNDDSRLLEFTNEAIQRLLEKGRWWGTVVKARFCITSGCLTWPRNVAAIDAVQLDSSPIAVKNQWFEFLEYRDPSCCCETSAKLQDRGTAPTVVDVVGSKKVRAYITDTSDATKRVLIQGYDQNRSWVRTQLGGQWYDGEWLTLAYPHVTSTNYFTSITGIQKNETNLRVAIYEYNPVNGGMRTLAIMEPDEKIANYRRSYIGCLSNFSNPTACESSTVTAMVKLDYAPVKKDEDWLLIANIPALKDMIMSITKLEKNETAEAQVLERKAIQTLNDELRTFTSDKRSFNIAAHGSAPLSYHTAGYN
jgi:hypothetical protein